MGKHVVWKYFFPSVDAEMMSSIDRQSMQNIRNASLAVCILETLCILVFMTLGGWRFEGPNLASFISVSFCAVFSLIVFLLSKSMIKHKELPHWRFLVVKVVFYAVFSLWAVFADMRHYAVGDQMSTFFTVQLLAACFIMFEPFIGLILVSAAYGGLYAAAYSVQQAEGIDVFNFVILAILTAVGMCVQYHTQLYLAQKEKRLLESSRRDALTKLRNRLALEEDVNGLYGTTVVAYMVDIDYFKEFNDRYGHAMGDEILKEAGNVLRKLYPDALLYRYGGDEFLILSKCDDSHYTGASYSFKINSPGQVLTVAISIGCAKGEPQSYGEMFDLISRADAALYATKVRTHSPEHGGHDRRQRR